NERFWPINPTLWPLRIHRGLFSHPWSRPGTSDHLAAPTGGSGIAVNPPAFHARWLPRGHELAAGIPASASTFQDRFNSQLLKAKDGEKWPSSP
ncbi:unnamed protein product, partial [Gulo gulo]